MSASEEDDRDENPQEEDGPEKVAPKKVSSRALPIPKRRLDPQVAAGLGRCLQARLDRLDADIAHAKDLALKQPFYAHWAGHLEKIRTASAKHLTEFESDAKPREA